MIYLVDSAGVFLPLQDEIFPDEDDFGRIFRNNAVLSAAGIPQYAAVMGNCIAGGAYLPVLCDKLLMTDGSQLCLAGPALVKAAIGQTVDPEELGGAAMHAAISGTVDFHEPNDESCLRRLRSLVELLPRADSDSRRRCDACRRTSRLPIASTISFPPTAAASTMCATCWRASSMTIRCRNTKPSSARRSSRRSRKSAATPSASSPTRNTAAEPPTGELQIGGVIYPDAADKAARFVMDCNQSRVPIVFLQDVQGFMVGKQAEQAGIIRAGAKLVNVVSNSIVPKLTVSSAARSAPATTHCAAKRTIPRSFSPGRRRNTP